MTIAEVLAEVDEIKPNQYDDALKIQWISRLEGKIYSEIINTHELKKKTVDTDEIENIIPDDFGSEGDEEEKEEPEEMPEETEEKKEAEDAEFYGYTEADIDTVLVVPDTYADVYKYYLFAMVDFATGETARYTNSMLMFNAAYSDYSHWYNRTHKPKSTKIRY